MYGQSNGAMYYFGGNAKNLADYNQRYRLVDGKSILVYDPDLGRNSNRGSYDANGLRGRILILL